MHQSNDPDEVDIDDMEFDEVFVLFPNEVDVDDMEFDELSVLCSLSSFKATGQLQLRPDKARHRHRHRPTTTDVDVDHLGVTGSVSDQ